MKHITLTKGLDIPISGEPEQVIQQGPHINHVALLGDDGIGMKPTMEVQVGDPVATGQLLYTDKKNPGVKYTAPGSGVVVAINRGEKRKFESLVIELDGGKPRSFVASPKQPQENYRPEQIREILIESGLWTTLTTRPYGKVPGVASKPASLFITAADSNPLAADPEMIIKASPEAYKHGLGILRSLLDVPIHYCTEKRDLLPCEQLEGLHYWSFSGPHPSGLPSTHIHFIDPVHEHKVVWQINYQDVIDIGHLFLTGQLNTERVISLGGPGVVAPTLFRTRIGASLKELSKNKLIDEPTRIVSGSILAGRTGQGFHNYLGRSHNQVSVLPDNSGRSLLNWAMPGSNRFSVKPVFISSLAKKLSLTMNTALWGGRRAIYPLGTYEDVMPLDIIPIYLLKALAVGDTEKSKALGCMELIEEDLSLCGFGCPGKNEFGPQLRAVLTSIELEG